MDSTLLMLVEFSFSLTSWTVISWVYLLPAARKRPVREMLTPLLLLHSFRHIGLIYLMPQVVPEPPPASFAEPTAWGDLATATLALVALTFVRGRLPGARLAVWMFNVVGFVDLLFATYTADKVQVMNYAIGPAYALPVLIVPALLVTHVLIFWLLLRNPASPETDF